MAKISLTFPDKKLFTTEIAVMVTDLVGGIHVGNHKLVAYLTETQMRFLVALGFPDLIVDGKITINTDLAVNYISEVHYGDILVVDVAIDDINQRNYDIVFRATKKGSGKVALVAKMGMVFLDLDIHRVVDIPELFVLALQKLS